MKVFAAKALWLIIPTLILGALWWLIQLTLPSRDEISIPCTSRTIALARIAAPSSIDKSLSQSIKKLNALADINQATREVMQIDTLSKLYNAGPEISVLWERSGSTFQTVYHLIPTADRADWKAILQGWADMRGFTLREVRLNEFPVIEVRANRKVVLELYFSSESILVCSSPNALETYLEAPKKGLVLKKTLPKTALAGFSIFLVEGAGLIGRLGMAGIFPVAMRETYHRLDATVFPSSIKTEISFSANFRFSVDKCIWPEPMQNISAYKSKKNKAVKPDLWTDWAINTEAQEVALRPAILNELKGFDKQMLEILKRKPQLACGFGDSESGTIGFCLRVSKEEGVAIVQEIVQRTKADPVSTAGSTTVWRINKAGDTALHDSSTTKTYYLASKNEWLIMSRSMIEVASHLDRLPESFTEKAFSAKIDLKKQLERSGTGWLSEQYTKFPLTVSSLETITYDISGSNLSGSLKVLKGSYLVPKLVREMPERKNAFGLNGPAELAESDAIPGYAYAGQVGDSLVIFNLNGQERLAVKQHNRILVRPFCTQIAGNTYAFIATEGGITALQMSEGHAKTILLYPGKGKVHHVLFSKFKDDVYLSILNESNDAVYTAAFSKSRFSEWTQILEKSHIYYHPFLASNSSALFVVYNVGGDSLRAIPIAGTSSSRTLLGSPGMSQVSLVMARIPGQQERIGFITDRGLFHQYALDTNILTSTKQIYRPNTHTIFHARQAENSANDFHISRFDGRQYTFYGSDFKKEFSLDHPSLGDYQIAKSYLFHGVQRYYKICGKECRWYNILGQEIFLDEKTRPDFLFEEDGSVKSAKNVNGRLEVYQFR